MFVMEHTLRYSIVLRFVLTWLLVAAAQFPPSGIQLLNKLFHQFGQSLRILLTCHQFTQLTPSLILFTFAVYCHERNKASGLPNGAYAGLKMSTVRPLKTQGLFATPTMQPSRLYEDISRSSGIRTALEPFLRSWPR